MKVDTIFAAVIFGQALTVAAIPAQLSDETVERRGGPAAPECVYITAEFGGGAINDRAAMLVRNRSDKNWRRVCGGYASGKSGDETLKCCSGYSMHMNMAGAVGKKTLSVNAGFKTFDVPQAKFDGSGCTPGRGGNPNGNVGCVEISWSLNTCPDLASSLSKAETPCNV
jgi:hypothetical protein